MAKAKAKARYGFIREAGSGKTEHFRNVETGEIIPRRQFDKIRREKELGEKATNEKLAKLNKQVEPLKQAARPARGRTSIQKFDPKTREDIARSRVENKKALEEADKLRKEEKKEQKRIELAKQRFGNVKVKKITARLLRPGHMSANVEFNDYDEYLSLFEQGKKSGKIFAYSIQLIGVDRHGAIKTPTVFKMKAFDIPIDEDEFVDTINELTEEKSYFLLIGLRMHLAFSKEFSEKHAKTSKQKPKQKHK
jgi:hypothetical protein